MRNAGMILGIIAGLWGMLVGFFGYGYTEFIAWFGEIPDLAEQVDHVDRIRFVSLVAPILAIAGGAMAIARPMIGGAAMVLSALGMYWGFSFGVFTMFPIAMALLGGALALGAGGLKQE